MQPSEFEIVIGLEIHIQLNLLSKAFCSDSTAFGASPNTQISAISLGHPGTLPFFNKKQIESAIRLSLAIGGEIQPVSFFDRKNYFYADLPKGFQTTQDTLPVSRGGEIAIKTPNGLKKIRIHHFHMEEDAGKSIHDRSEKYSFLDLNRAGTPLLELVTEPDFRNAEEVSSFLFEIRRLVRWIEISDGNMEEGSLRCDINLSVRKPGENLNTRCEIKNVNSMRFARKAIEFESNRQINLIRNGEKVIQQTRTFNPSSGETSALREKEDAHDYRYFPEPDLPPIIIEADTVEKIRKSMPEMPCFLEEKFSKKYGLANADIELLLNEKSHALFLTDLIEITNDAKFSNNLLINYILPFIEKNKLKIENYLVYKNNILIIFSLLKENKVNKNSLYQIIVPQFLKNPEQNPAENAEKMGLFSKEFSDIDLEKIAEKVIENWPEKVAEFKKGKKGLLGLFVGEAMKMTGGKADPTKITRFLQKKLA